MTVESIAPKIGYVPKTLLTWVKRVEIDMDGEDLFALMSALSWLAGQPSFAPRADHLFHIVASAILTNRSSSDVEKQR